MENIINTIGISAKDIKKVFTPKQFAIIKDNLRAYFVNMGYIHIEKADYGKGWYIFKSAEDAKNGSYVQFCEHRLFKRLAIWSCSSGQWHYKG